MQALDFSFAERLGSEMLRQETDSGADGDAASSAGAENGGSVAEHDAPAQVDVSIGSGGYGLGDDRPGASTLIGTFYDLKPKANGDSSGIRAPFGLGATVPENDLPKVHKLLHDFTDKWSGRLLSSYFRAKRKLYASHFYLPSSRSEYAPIAFRCKDRVKPAAWVAVYRGKVRAPKSGRFRFVGTADDLIAVRFNKRVVLEAGWCITSTYKKAYKKGEGTKTGTRYCTKTSVTLLAEIRHDETMPWNTKSQQRMKKEFIRPVTRKEVSMSEACMLYGISRRTGYKWLHRYEE